LFPFANSYFFADSHATGESLQLRVYSDTCSNIHAVYTCSNLHAVYTCSNIHAVYMQQAPNQEMWHLIRRCTRHLIRRCGTPLLLSSDESASSSSIPSIEHPPPPGGLSGLLGSNQPTSSTHLQLDVLKMLQRLPLLCLTQGRQLLPREYTFAVVRNHVV